MNKCILVKYVPDGSLLGVCGVYSKIEKKNCKYFLVAENGECAHFRDNLYGSCACWEACAEAHIDTRMEEL